MPSPTPLSLTTRHTSENRLGASTTYMEDQTNDRRVEITIELPVSDFNDTHLLRLPYILFHEIFVHAPKSWGASTSRRELPKEERTTELCAFREGFVDAAALYVLRKGLSVRGRTSQLHELHGEFARDYSAKAKTAHVERRSKGPTGQLPRGGGENIEHVIKARERGGELFDQFRELNLGDEAVKVAVCVNHLTLTTEQRNRLLTALEEAVKALEMAGDPEFWQQGHYEPGLTRWLEAHGKILAMARAGRGSLLIDFVDRMVDTTPF